MSALHDEAAELDRACGEAPHDRTLASRRAELLDRLAVREHGLVFRYVPAGSFRMGSDDGDADERPVHDVNLNGFWLSETTVSWADYNRLMGWGEDGWPPRDKLPPGEQKALFFLAQANKIRLQYCEDKTQRAIGWHAHDPMRPEGGGAAKPAAPVAHRVESRKL